MATPKHPKRPKDPIQLAREVFQEAIDVRPRAYTPDSSAETIEPGAFCEAERPGRRVARKTRGVERRSGKSKEAKQVAAIRDCQESGEAAVAKD
jgi:hypothetical protein